MKKDVWTRHSLYKAQMSKMSTFKINNICSNVNLQKIKSNPGNRVFPLIISFQKSNKKGSEIFLSFVPAFHVKLARIRL